MLCESRLWHMTFCSDSECMDPPTCHSVTAPKTPPLTTSLSAQIEVPVHCSPSSPSQELQTQHGNSQPLSAPLDCRNLSPGMGIPGRAPSPGTEAFLVPPSCHSICQHYNDLYIAGGQVLPLSPGAGNPEGSSLQDPLPGPFLLSRDVPPPSLLPPLLPEHKNSKRWREGSLRERLSLLQDGRPLSNSELNGYLEQKLLELYTEYLTEGPILASEIEQITLQLSREHKLETGQVKDMLLSCLLKATSSQQSSEFSTPMLQISTQTK
ncbi:TLR adapter interacting with SLC15A4 on the lysosome [Neoarius graeffei]|uniref:TLR adapter interacting with SLC15A4 on the lysosome n=1 Tax=Neoarius graeffei TaxID=443677 RepID=UPI00298C08B1|nr:TLR adapter interacting with SLC15A4 on the lysosome [Neoarius graeffei]